MKQYPEYMKYNFYQRLKPIITIVENENRTLRVLDIGSGCGTESLYFSLIGCDVTGVELLYKHHEVAKERKQILEKNLGRKTKCRFEHGSILEYQPDEKFDLVWMEEAFHHLEPRELVVKKICSLVKPNGYIILSEANALNILLQLGLFRMRGFNTIIQYKDDDGTDHIWGHERILTASRLAKWFKRENVIVSEIQYFRLLPNKFLDYKIFVFIEQIFVKYCPVFIRAFISLHYNFIGKFKS